MDPQNQQLDQNPHSETIKQQESPKILYLIIVTLLIIISIMAYTMNSRIGFNSSTPEATATPMIHPTRDIIVSPTAQIENNLKKYRYDNGLYGFFFSYPSYWINTPKSQIFEQGDLVNLGFTGPTQIEQTEFYDGVRFTVAKPFSITTDLEQWVREQFSETVNGDPYEIINETITTRNNISNNYIKVYGCGLGCFTYYFTKQGATIYGFNTFAEGADKAKYIQEIQEVFKTIYFFTIAKSQ